MDKVQEQVQLLQEAIWSYEEVDSQYGPVRFVNWMRIPDAASAHSNWMQQSDVVRSRFWKFWIMRLKIVSSCSYVRLQFCILYLDEFYVK